MATSEEFKFLAVGAIDFGTTYSGYAYSFRHSPTVIERNRWNAGSRGLISEKTPTCILFDENKSFVAFGFDAEDEFAEMCYNKKQNRCYFFRGYKMELYDKMVVKRDTIVNDIQGKELPLLKVVCETIKYLKKVMVEDISVRLDTLEDKDVLYVLTVPAIWTDSAKAFMREAAEEAGIPSEQLRICLEPEAAAIYCKTIPCQSQRGLSASQLDLLKPGSRYILIDAGGGTADVIAHEVDVTGALKELRPASGGNWGGQTVDVEFLELLKQFHGDEAFNEFQKRQTLDYFDLLREFEVKKRSRQAQTDAKKPVVLRIPMSLQHLPTGKANTEAVSESLNSLTLDDDKIRLEQDLFRQFFKGSIERIVSHVNELLQNTELTSIPTLVLVGGYAESKLLQDFIRASFHTKTVIIPNQPGLAVLKGGVIFGHDPSVIAERVCRFTYGIGCCLNFDPNKHKESTKFTDDFGVVRAQRCFDIHCKLGQNVKTNAFQPEHSYVPTATGQKTAHYHLYACPRANPIYTTEKDCFKIGEMTVDRSNMTRQDLDILVALCFGGTEITIRANKKQTGEILTASIKYDW